MAHEQKRTGVRIRVTPSRNESAGSLTLPGPRAKGRTSGLSPDGVRGHGEEVREARASGRSWPAVLLITALFAVVAPAVSVAQSRSAAQQLESIRRRMEAGLAL